MDTAAFFATLAPMAVQARLEGSPLFPSVRLAQNLLETGGNIHSWNNLGGIKVGTGKPNPWWDGAYVRKPTWEIEQGKRIEIMANFREYRSVYHFYKDQDLLFEKSRYAGVRTAKSPDEQADALYQSGYATDPQYAVKLKTLIRKNNLTQFDEEAERMLDELKKQIERLQARVDKLEARDAAPAWFLKEFGSGDLEGIIHEPYLSAEGWRVLAIALRAANHAPAPEAPE